MTLALRLCVFRVFGLKFVASVSIITFGGYPSVSLTISNCINRLVSLIAGCPIILIIIISVRTREVSSDMAYQSSFVSQFIFTCLG